MFPKLWCVWTCWLFCHENLSFCKSCKTLCKQHHSCSSFLQDTLKCVTKQTNWMSLRQCQCKGFCQNPGQGATLPTEDLSLQHLQQQMLLQLPSMLLWHSSMLQLWSCPDFLSDYSFLHLWHKEIPQQMQFLVFCFIFKQSYFVLAALHLKWTKCVLGRVLLLLWFSS